MSEDSILTPLVKDRMLALGFRKRTSLTFTIELAPDIQGSIGLNTASRYTAAGTWNVNPIMGVRHQEVARIEAQLAGRKYHPYMAPPVSRSIGFLMPVWQFVEWPLGDFPEAEQNAEDMVAAIRDYGLPFMHSHATNETILDAINQNIGIRDNQDRAKPILLALMGRRDEAATAMNELVGTVASATSPYAQKIRSFSGNFFVWLDTRSTEATTIPGQPER